MIRFDPSLSINRFVILKSGGALCDERFHHGVNILRGENSTGKSTISDFIFYSLGGELTNWTPEALAADSVHVEVQLCGATHTLSRNVEESGKAAMFFYEGTYEAAMANRDAWLKYPAVRSSHTESFSQVLFRLLHFPELLTEAQQNITMHQILRLLYCDQITPVNQIFRQELRYDTRDIRSAIGELLLGFDDLALHDLRMRLRETDRKYGEIVGELQSMFGLLGRTSDSDVAAFDFDDEMKKLANDRAEAITRVEQLSHSRDERTRREATEKAVLVAEALRTANERISQATQRTRDLELESEDSRQFIQTLSDRVAALDASGGMEQYLGKVTFPYCPVCLTPIDDNASVNSCHLCKAPIPEKGFANGRLKMREELTFQIRESSQIVARKSDELVKLKRELAAMERERKSLWAQVEQFKSRIDPLDAEIATWQQRVGYLERSLEDLARKAELSKIVKERMRERETLSLRLTELRNALESLDASRIKRREEVKYRIVQLCVDALRADLPMEEAFVNAELVDFDFGQNRLAVNGRVKFSASSSTYLKNAFLFSLFQLSLEDSEVRWPRFILLDNIEDKGMRPERSANFQEYVVRSLLEAKVTHQVIMTTSMISERLENSDYCVGAHFVPQNKTLKFAVAKD